MLGGWEENPAVGFMNTLEESTSKVQSPKVCAPTISGSWQRSLDVPSFLAYSSLVGGRWTLDIGRWTLQTCLPTTDFCLLSSDYCLLTTD